MGNLAPLFSYPLIGTHTRPPVACTGSSDMNSQPAPFGRWGGLAATVAGLLFILVQAIHPAETLAAVTTSRWALVHALTMLMPLFGLLGLTALHTRQAGAAGWPGVTGYILLSLWLILVAAFTFVEAFILPLIAASSPGFVQSFLGLFSGRPGEMDLGVLAAAGPLSGLLYMLGGLLFGLGTVQARVLPRPAGVSLAVSALLPVVVSVLPHAMQRVAAVPMGLSLAWLGYALWQDCQADLPAVTSLARQPGEASLPEPLR